MDRAAHDAVYFSFFNTGQVCCSVERIYVDAIVKDEFERRVLEYARNYSAGERDTDMYIYILYTICIHIVVVVACVCVFFYFFKSPLPLPTSTKGPGCDESSKVGPMVSAMQRDIVAQQVDSAVKQGARLLYQGSTPSTRSGEYANGNWYPPTVLADVTNDMPINLCETFGPVVALATFDGSERHAIQCANDSEYGLASYVYTSDMVRAQRVAKGIKAGQVGINCYSLFHANVMCPWVGHKGSGFGYHSGADGWRQFSLPKSLVFETPLPPPVIPAASL